MITKELSLLEIQEIYETYLLKDFPKDETRPWKNLKSLYQQGLYKAYGFFDKDTLLAYAFFVTAKTPYPAALLDYLAVLSNGRGKGTGSLFLQDLKNMCRSTFSLLFLESENPDYAHSEDDLQIRTRRLAFYEKNGFIKTKVASCVYGVEYCIFAVPFQLDSGMDLNTETFQMLDRMYRQIFSEKIYKEEVHFHSF